MRIWKKWFVAVAAPLLLTGCLWGPGKFGSTLTLKRDGSFTLAYKGEILLQRPDELGGKKDLEPTPWRDSFARCRTDGTTEVSDFLVEQPDAEGQPKVRPCTPAELAKLKSGWATKDADRIAAKRKEGDDMAKAFGLPGYDDESNRAFAAKLTKYAGWRSVQYRGKGVFEVDYQFEGRATQDFVFPAIPDNDLIMPFIALRRRTDGSVQVTAPMFAGLPGPFGRAAMMGLNRGKSDEMATRAQGRFTIVTDGEILTNNSEDGPSTGVGGKQLVWDVTPQSQKIPEALIRL